MSKPRLSFWEIWNMSFGFLGIQFGFALQNSNVSRINITSFLDEVSVSVFQINKGFLFTLKELFLRPGKSLNEYLFYSI